MVSFAVWLAIILLGAMVAATFERAGERLVQGNTLEAKAGRWIGSVFLVATVFVARYL